MEKWKRFLIKIFRPGRIVTLVLVLIAAPALIWILRTGMENLLAYIVYALSAYTLTCLLFYMPPLLKEGKKKVLSNKLISRYVYDRAFHDSISLWQGLLVNLAFAVFKFIASCLYRSFWFGAIAAYYAVLSVIRFIILRGYRRTHETARQKYRHGLKIYRRCGFFMLILILTISGISLQMIRDHYHYHYPGYFIFVSAGYTFYSLVSAVVQAVKQRRGQDPILSAAKMLGVSVALMSMFSLQTSMFAVFGEGSDGSFQMNIATGTAVCLIILTLSVLMILKGTVLLRRKEPETSM